MAGIAAAGRRTWQATGWNSRLREDPATSVPGMNLVAWRERALIVSGLSRIGVVLAFIAVGFFAPVVAATLVVEPVVNGVSRHDDIDGELVARRRDFDAKQAFLRMLERRDQHSRALLDGVRHIVSSLPDGVRLTRIRAERTIRVAGRATEPAFVEVLAQTLRSGGRSAVFQGRERDDAGETFVLVVEP